MQKLIGKSGKEIVINPAPWKDAKELKRAIEAAAATVKIPTKISADDISGLLNIALLVDSSKEVESALWPCLIRCTRNNMKITEETFDDTEARKDYYEIIAACVKENFGPFAADLFFMLAALGLELPTPPAKEGAALKSE